MNNQFVIVFNTRSFTQNSIKIDSSYIGIFSKIPMYIRDPGVIESSIYFCRRNIKICNDNTHPSLKRMIDNTSKIDLKIRILKDNNKNLKKLLKLMVNIYYSSN